jgi:hypothetical protein
MNVMVTVNAMKNREAGITPSVKMLTEMSAFNAEIRAQWDRLCLEETT